jgi:drug/metabolite transporter (DMT)-like permease
MVRSEAMKTKTAVPLALVALGTIWGSAFILMKVLVDEISPAQIVAARLTLGATVLLAALALTGRFRLPAPGLVPPVALLCVIDNMIPNTLVAWSETRIDGGTASVLMSTMPLFTTVFAMTALKEGIHPLRVAGLALGFVGVMVVSNGHILDIRSDGGVGMVAVVGAACSHAVAAIYTKVLLSRDDPLRLTTWKLTSGAVMTLPLVLITQGGGAYNSMSAEAILCLAILGVMATGLAYSLYIWVVGAAGAVQASLVTYIIPVAGLALSWLVLGEEIGLITLAGTAVIVAGVASAMFGPSFTPTRLQFRRRHRGPALAQPADL